MEIRWQEIWFSILDFVGFGTSEKEISCICNFLDFFYWIVDRNKVTRDLVLDSWWRFRRFWICNFLNFFIGL